MQRSAVALVCLLSGLLVGFVVVAVAAGDEPVRAGPTHGVEPRRGPATWRRVRSSSGRYSVELPGRPVDDSSVIALAVDRTVPIASRRVTTSDGTTASIAELDYSAAVGSHGYDLRLGAAGAVIRAGGSIRRFDEVASSLGSAASFSGGGGGLEIRGFLVSSDGEVVLLLVTSPSGSDAAAGAILRMASSLSTS